MLNTDVAPVQAAEAVEEVTVNSHGNKFMQTPSGMLMEVPVVPFAAMGSPLDEFAELIRDNGFEHVSFPVDGVHRGSYYAFRVEGDSMDDGTRDSFQPGDIVLVRELDRSDWAPRLHFGKWPYWARHSWATIAASLDIPNETIAAALGHSYGNRVTSIYINFDEKKIDAANRSVLNLINKKS